SSATRRRSQGQSKLWRSESSDPLSHEAVFSGLRSFEPAYSGRARPSHASPVSDLCAWFLPYRGRRWQRTAGVRLGSADHWTSFGADDLDGAVQVLEGCCFAGFRLRLL